MRLPNALTRLAWELDQVEFSQPLSATELQWTSDRLFLSRPGFKHCQRIASRKDASGVVWSVNASIGKRTRVIGLRTGLSDITVALRFADMATLFFWTYRAYKTPYSKDDFNYSPEQAERDLAGCTDAVVLLEKLEAYFKEIYALPADPGSAVPATRRKAGSMRDMLKLLADEAATAAKGRSEMNAKMDDLRTSFSKIVTVLTALTERLNTLK